MQLIDLQRVRYMETKSKVLDSDDIILLKAGKIARLHFFPRNPSADIATKSLSHSVQIPAKHLHP